MALSQFAEDGSYRLLAPIGMLGYGIIEDSLNRGVAARPHVIGCDNGSSEPGPYYLGSGASFTSAELVIRDMALCLRPANELGIPFVVGSAGGAGGEPHLGFALDCLRKAAGKEGLSGLRVALIHAEQPKPRVRALIESGRTTTFSAGPEPTVEDVDACERIVAQLGTATIARALGEEPDVVLAGRACDVAILAGPAVEAGADEALAMSLAKVMECGAHCAEPASGRDGIAGELFEDHFVLWSPNPHRRCTPEGVAGHMLYENAHPYRLSEPEGLFDLSQAVIEAIDDRTVRVSGVAFEPAERFSVKLEGAAQIGYRSIVVGGMRDPRLVAAVDHVLDLTREAVGTAFGEDGYSLSFRVYGRDGVLGESESDGSSPQEIGLLCEVVAETQTLAHAVAHAAEAAIITAPYPGGISTTGNLAVPFSPIVIDAGPAYEWRLYCLAEPDDEASTFDVELVTI